MKTFSISDTTPGVPAPLPNPETNTSPYVITVHSQFT